LPNCDKKPKRINEIPLLLLAGKGGVGKTFVAASLAFALSKAGAHESSTTIDTTSNNDTQSEQSLPDQENTYVERIEGQLKQNRRVLLAQMNAPAGLGSILDMDEPSESERPWRTNPNLWTVNLDPSSCLASFGTLRLKKRNIIEGLLKKAFSDRFMTAVPGIRSLALMGRLWFYTQERSPEGAPRFHNIIGETAGLGHIERLLGQPTKILSILPPSVLKRDLEEIVAMLQDPDRVGIVLVTTPESIAVNETIELKSRLEEMNHRIALLVINDVIENTACTNPILRKLLKTTPSLCNQSFLIEETRFLKKRQALQKKMISKLRESFAVSIIELPHIPTVSLKPQEISFLASKLECCWSNH